MMRHQQAIEMAASRRVAQMLRRLYALAVGAVFAGCAGSGTAGAPRGAGEVVAAPSPSNPVLVEGATFRVVARSDLPDGTLLRGRIETDQVGPISVPVEAVWPVDRAGTNGAASRLDVLRVGAVDRDRCNQYMVLKNAFLDDAGAIAISAVKLRRAGGSFFLDLGETTRDVCLLVYPSEGDRAPVVTFAEPKAAPLPAPPSPATPPAAAAAEPISPASRRGWGTAKLTAFRFPGSGACSLEGGKYNLVGSYTMETLGVEQKAAVHVDTSRCDLLEKDHAQLTGVLVRVQSQEAIAVPLERGSAQLAAIGGSLKTSVALLAPFEAESERPWIKTFDGGTLVLNIDAGAAVDLLFLFDGQDRSSSSSARLRIAGLDLLFARTPSPLAIETARRWSIRDPALPGKKPRCRTDATLSTSGDNYSTRRGSVLDFQQGEPQLWCWGAKHTWLGRSRNVEGVFELIASSEDDPLRFEVTKDGYRYSGGRGFLVLRDHRVVRFPGEDRGGRPATSVPPR